ncbi:MAG: hypothetical protein K1Y36_28415 [Blastocatellia bacterium]|nr:hypothetical protein [Blastocatellia bacterium]
MEEFLSLTVPHILSDANLEVLPTQKFDEHLPEELLRKRALNEQYDWKQVFGLIQKLVQPGDR